MKRLVYTVGTTALLGASLLAQAPAPNAPAQAGSREPGTARQGSAPAGSGVQTASTVDLSQPDQQTALVKQYCVACHNDRAKPGTPSFAAFDAAKTAENGAITEKMIRRLRAGMMPPPGARRPDPQTISALIDGFESRIDRAAATTPNPGGRSFQRLNRAEYGRAVKDMLDLDVDVTGLLPADTISAGFDNVADVQVFSPALMESYLRAASKVTLLAVGDREATSAESLYRVPKTASQWTRVDGAPFGTRGGISVQHTFLADGDYVFRLELHANACGYLFGGPTTGEQIEVSLDGERRVLMNVNPNLADQTTGLAMKTPNIHVTAGTHRVTAAFIQRFEGPINDLIAPIDHTLADTQIGVAYGITTLPHLKDLSIVGPTVVTGVSDTTSRRKVFTCRPTTAAEETPCASEIVKRMATQAFRRPVTEKDLSRLMQFYADGRKERDFEYGVASALEAILASPQFLFRLESTPATVKAGQTYRVGQLELASRLSYFIWGVGPDDELLKLANAGRLRAPGVIGKQVTRMLADPRSEALATRFAAQWLRLHDVDAMLPDAILYPYYDKTLGQAFVHETELFFDSIVREDRPVTDLLTADHTFVNERIARHYGIANVTGSEFRRVKTADRRYGILGQGSVLVLTSVADRTSPVMRGKWVMEVLLGSPPPPPPPGVPLFEETKGTANGKFLTVRERMEEHRKSPQCASCHRVIDPLGLALENFDVTGKWRYRDTGVLVDSKGELYDGTKMDGPEGLRDALLKHKDVFLLSFTENLLTYALGRRVEAYDMPAVRRIIRDAGRSDLRISSFILGVVESPAFQMNTAVAATDAAAER